MPVTDEIGFERLLAYHSAPAMLGIKPANLVSAEGDEELIHENVERFNRRARARGLGMIELRRSRGRTLIMVMGRRQLERQLFSEDIHELLLRFGYGTCRGLDSYLGLLSSRLREREDFPHEIGLFLGYPAEDVTGFIRNKGENYKLCGYWKVYSNETKARRLFTSYDRCRKYMMARLDRGDDIYSALKIG